MLNLFSYILYVLVFSNSIFWSYVYSKHKNNGYKKNEKVLYGFLIIIPVVILQGYRYNVGTDYQSYLSLYNGFSNGNKLFISWYTNEPLFICICKILYNLTGGAKSALFIFDALLMGIFSFLTFDYYKEKASMPIMYLFYYSICLPYFFNTERQGVAVTFLWYATHFIYEKKVIKFFLCILIAVLVHNTAIVGVIFYFIVVIEKKDNVYIKRLLTICAALMPVIFGFSINFLSKYVPIFSKYTKFLTETRAEALNTNFIIFAFMLLILFLLRKFISYEQAFFIFFMSTMCVMTFLLNNYIAGGFRMSFYFVVGLMLGYGNIYKNLHFNANKRLLSMFLVVLMVFYFTYKFYIQGNCQIFPYQSIWFI